MQSQANKYKAVPDGYILIAPILASLFTFGAIAYVWHRSSYDWTILLSLGTWAISPFFYPPPWGQQPIFHCHASATDNGCYHNHRSFILDEILIGLRDSALIVKENNGQKSK